MISASVGNSMAADMELRVKPAARFSNPLSMSQPRDTSTAMPPIWVSMPIQGKM